MGKTDDESTPSAARERRSGAMARSVPYETLCGHGPRDSSHKYAPQGAKLLSFATKEKAAEDRHQHSILCECPAPAGPRAENCDEPPNKFKLRPSGSEGPEPQGHTAAGAGEGSTQRELLEAASNSVSAVPSSDDSEVYRV